MGCEGGFPVDGEHLVDVFLFVVGLAGFSYVDDACVGEREPGGGDESAAAARDVDDVGIPALLEQGEVRARSDRE